MSSLRQAIFEIKEKASHAGVVKGLYKGAQGGDEDLFVGVVIEGNKIAFYKEDGQMYRTGENTIIDRLMVLSDKLMSVSNEKDEYPQFFDVVDEYEGSAVKLMQILEREWQRIDK